MAAVAFKKVLVAYDGSEASKHALEYAVDITNMNSGLLIILTVVPKMHLPVFPDEGFGTASITAANDLGDYQDRLVAMYKKNLEESENNIKEHYPTLNVKNVLIEARPSATIVEQAEKYQVDLIVIGSRGLGGISGWILGSTSRRVVESCTKPILIIK